MVVEKEGWVRLKDGMRLFEKIYEPQHGTNAHLVFFHGFSDRSEIQYDLFPTLASPPYNVTCHAIDQRGWGKSVQHSSQRGLTGTTNQVLADMDEYIRRVHETLGDPGRTPLFLMGHSMGGQQLLHYLLTTSPSITSRAYVSGAILEAPYISLDPKSQPSSLLVMAGKVAARVSPKSQMKQTLDSRYITRDAKVNQEWKEDALCHDHGTLEGLRDMLQRGADLEQLSRPSSKLPTQLSTRLPLPVFWAHGTADRITAFAPSQALFNQLDPLREPELPRGVIGKTFKAYENAYHKIHAEPDGMGQAFSKDVGDWIMEIVSALLHSSSPSGNAAATQVGSAPADRPTFPGQAPEAGVILKSKL